VPAHGDRALLDHLAVNLVDNAVWQVDARANPDGGLTVTVVLR
jgi:hypothetical protein